MLVRIADNGPGISKKTLLAALNPALQMRTRPSNGGEVSVGLYLARANIEMQGGTLEVKPASGHGTEVLVTLPTDATDLIPFS